MASKHVLNFLRGSFKSRAYSGETRVSVNHSRKGLYAFGVRDDGVHVILRLDNGYIYSHIDTPEFDIYSEPEDIEDIEARLALMREIEAVMPLLKHLHSLPEDTPMPVSTPDDAAIQYITDLLGAHLSSVSRRMYGVTYFYLTYGGKIDVCILRTDEQARVTLRPEIYAAVTNDAVACRKCASAYRQLADCLELLERCLPDIEAKL